MSEVKDTFIEASLQADEALAKSEAIKELSEHIQLQMSKFGELRDAKMEEGDFLTARRYNNKAMALAKVGLMITQYQREELEKAKAVLVKELIKD